MIPGFEHVKMDTTVARQDLQQADYERIAYALRWMAKHRDPTDVAPGYPDAERNIKLAHCKQAS